MTYQIDRSQFIEHGPALRAADAIARIHHAALYAALTDRQSSPVPTPPSPSDTKEFAMIDQQFDRDYQAGRAELNAGLVAFIRRLLAQAAKGFATLNRIQFSAPWTTPRPR